MVSNALGYRLRRSTAAKSGFVVAAVMLFGSLTYGANIGYVVDPGADIDELFDIFWTERLEAQGHTVIPIGADEPADLFPDADIFVISNDVASGDVINGFGVDDPRAMISSGEWGLNDEWGISDIQGENSDEMTITIEDPTHPLAAGLSGDVDVFSDIQPISVMLGEPAPDLDIIATVDRGFDVVPVIVALEEGGATSPTGLEDPSPGLRIFLFSRTHPEGGDLYTDDGLAILDASVAYALGIVPDEPRLKAGDADQDLDFDQLDLVKVQVAGKYLTGQPATWGDGDWDGAPGGSPGNPPPGNGFFDQLDIIAALGADAYLKGPNYGDGAALAALAPEGANVAIPVPEPAGVLLLGIGLAMNVAAWCRRKRWSAR